mgnify:CR=1 FL=1
MNLFGIEIQEKKGSRRTYGQDAAVALAGPAANLLAFAVCWGAFLLTSSLYLANLAAANLLLALLNRVLDENDADDLILSRLDAEGSS